MNRKFIISVALVIVLNLAGIGGWLWGYSHLTKMQTSIDDKASQLEIAEGKIKNIKSLEALLADISEERAKINSVFLERRNIVRFIESLEALAEETGTSLEVKTARLPQGTAKGPQFTFSVSGSFPSLFQYLALLENSSYQIFFNSVRFLKPDTKNSKKASGWRADFDVVVMSYLDS
jgi:hypothetical protein